MDFIKMSVNWGHCTPLWHQGQKVWEALTRLGGCCTGVRRGVRPPTPLFACWCRVWVFFFGFEPTWLDSHWLGFDSSRTRLIWPESGSIGWIGSFRPVVETYRNGRKKAEIVRAQSQMAPPSSADLHLGIFLGKKLEHHHSHSGFLLHPLSLSLSLSIDLLCFLFFGVDALLVPTF